MKTFIEAFARCTDVRRHVTLWYTKDQEYVGAKHRRMHRHFMESCRSHLFWVYNFAIFRSSKTL